MRLHVEVDEDIVFGRRLQDGTHPEQQVSDRTFGINWVKRCRERTDFDGDVGPGD